VVLTVAAIQVNSRALGVKKFRSCVGIISQLECMFVKHHLLFDVERSMNYERLGKAQKAQRTVKTPYYIFYSVPISVPEVLSVGVKIVIRLKVLLFVRQTFWKASKKMPE